jgi:hypothetical protein
MLPFFTHPERKAINSYRRGKKCWGAGGGPLRAFPRTCASASARTSASRFSSLFRSRLVRTRARHAPSTGPPPAPQHFCRKTEQMFCFKKRGFTALFSIFGKIFSSPPLPLDTIRNNSRIFPSGCRPLVGNRPRPHPFGVCSFRLARPPLRRGRTFVFACPPAGAK